VQFLTPMSSVICSFMRRRCFINHQRFPVSVFLLSFHLPQCPHRYHNFFPKNKAVRCCPNISICENGRRRPASSTPSPRSVSEIKSCPLPFLQRSLSARRKSVHSHQEWQSFADLLHILLTAPIWPMARQLVIYAPIRQQDKAIFPAAIVS
jgi:hypothetical protein